MGEEPREEKATTLVNKVVRAKSDGTDLAGVVSFMYPNFLVKDDIFFDYNNSIIFTGKVVKDTRKMLEHGTREFIALSDSGIPDVDFTDRGTEIDILYSKFKRKCSEQTRETLMNLSDDDFWDFFKKYWVSGRSHLEDSPMPLWELTNALGGRRDEVLRTYFKMREYYSDTTLFNSVINYLERVANQGKSDVKNGIADKKMETFRKRYANVLPATLVGAFQLPSSTDEEKTFRLVWVLYQLGRGEVVTQ